MEDFDNNRSDRHPSRPKCRFPKSSVSDENDPGNLQTGFRTNAWKVSGSWEKTTFPVKRVLGERNESEDLHASVETVKPHQSPSGVSRLDEETLSLSPYDPLTNYLFPRPKFLRYKQNWRSEILTRMQDDVAGKDNESKDDLTETFRDGEEGDSDEASEEEEEEEEEENEQCFYYYGRQGRLKKLAWFVLLLFSAWYLYHIDVSSAPSHEIDGNEDVFSSWPIQNFTHQAASKNIDENSVLPGERDYEDDDEVKMSLGQIEGEMSQNFWDDHLSLELEELAHSVFGKPHVISYDNHENAATAHVNETVGQVYEGDHELLEVKKLHSGTTGDLHLVLSKIEETSVDSVDYPTPSQFEIPKTQDPDDDSLMFHWKMEAFPKIIILSLFVLVIVSSLVLGMFLKRNECSPKICHPQITEKLREDEPVVDGSCIAEPQSEEESLIEPLCSKEGPSAGENLKEEQKASLHQSLAPSVELLGEFIVGALSSSYKSNTITKPKNIEAHRSIHLVASERLETNTTSPKFLVSSKVVQSPSSGSSAFVRKEMRADKGAKESSQALPTPLRRSSRIRNRAT